MSYYNPLITITNVAGGWLTLQIEKHFFDVSYLSDFKRAMESLLDLQDYGLQVRRIFLDGEGSELFLTAWRHDNDLFIVWEAYPLYGEPDIELMKFDYYVFVSNYRHAFEQIADKYEEEFVWNPNKEEGEV